MKIHFEAKIIVEAESMAVADDRLYEELQKRGLQPSVPFAGWNQSDSKIIIDLSAPIK